jgi:hypothetical protein
MGPLCVSVVLLLPCLISNTRHLTNKEVLIPVKFGFAAEVVATNCVGSRLVSSQLNFPNQFKGVQNETIYCSLSLNNCRSYDGIWPVQ